MKLKAIETVGFKSFADKIEVSFGDGITSIVGPNGSGKSNIADAIRWVLGEQSIRTLRGNSMEDVIFSGSGTRRALNIAEVSLFFSNQDGILPVDFQEVTICRRLFRSGESSYFINKAPCRLKDIQDLFADTGLGKGSLSIVGQNKVDEILTGRPEDRRTLFEEAAGITRYKLRKKDAMRRLEETDNNLTRLDDIRAEIAANLEPLRESAEKTKKHNELAAGLKERRVTLAIRKIGKAQKMTEDAEGQIEGLRAEETDVSTETALHENKAFLFTEKLNSIAELVGHQQQNIAETQALAERLSGQKAVLAERAAQHKERCRSIAENIQRVENQAAQFKEKTGELAGRLKDEETIEQAAAEDKDKWASELAGKEERITAIGKAQEEEQINIFERKRNILQLGNDLRAQETAIAASARQMGQLATEMDTVAQKLSVVQNDLSGHKENIKTLLQKKQAHETDSGNTQQAIAQKRTALQSALAEGKQLEEAAVSLDARRNVLDRLQKEYEGFSHSVKKVMSAKENWRVGINGVVGELLDVPAHLVTAVETALGPALQNIVTADDAAAKGAIEYLKREKAGRATFLPLPNLKITRPNKEEEEAAVMPDILGFAGRLVGCAAEALPAIEFLLGRTVIAKNLEAAIKVSRQRNLRLRIVTLEGDVINAGGAMSGGSRPVKESGFLSRGQEIAEIREKLAALVKGQEESAARQNALTDEINVLEEEAKIHSRHLSAVEVEMAGANAYCREAEKQENQYLLGLETVKYEHATALEEGKTLQTALAKLRKARQQAEDDDGKLVGLAGELSRELQKAKDDRDTANDNFNNARVRYETAHNAAGMLREQAAALEEEGKQYDLDKKRLAKELADFEKSVATALAEQENIGEEIEKNAVQLDALRQERDATTGEQLELLSEQKILEQAGRELKNRLSGIQNRLRNAESIFVRYETELNLAKEQLAEQYALSMEEAEELCLDNITDVELLREAEKLEAGLLELGPVNPAAIEEYAQLKERHDFMYAQYQDLVSSKEQLETLINDINKTMSKRFREAFNAINVFFAECFSRLFDGGSASLKLIDPSDILSTGVDIIVQPPGKKLQTLALLSGGERALTVIALLFAMLSYRPAPFCVLDEVDAALDEVNVERFARFLTDFAQNTQFVVITHRKGTMQASHLMHGITMEESGVSKLLSVKMQEKKGALA